MPLLDDAKNCFVGQTQIKQIYAGTQKVWPKSVYPDTEYALNYFKCDNNFESFSPYVPASLAPPSDAFWYPSFSNDGVENQCIIFEENEKNAQNTVNPANYLAIDKNSLSPTDLKRIHCVEAYVKVGLVEEERNINVAYPANLLFYRRLTSTLSSNAGVSLWPSPDGTMEIRVFRAVGQPVSKKSELLIPQEYSFPSEIEYLKPRWVHVSIAMNTSAKKCEWWISVDGNVTYSSAILNITTTLSNDNTIWLNTIATSPNSPTPGHGEWPSYVLFDEIRTASVPLYTQDFIPS